MSKNTPQAPKIKLPFDKKQKGDFSSWMYRHRVGLLVTVVVYLSAIILFLSYRIVVKPATEGAIEVEFAEEKPPVIIEEEQNEIQKIEMAADEKLLNRSSDVNSTLDAPLRDSRKNNTSQTDKEVERIRSQMAEGQAAYDRSMREIENLGRKRSKADDDNSKSGTDDKRQSARYKGNVSVEWDLAGRSENYLHVPAYQCQNAGRVVIAITVNPNGRVVGAVVDKTTSSEDPCIMDMAVKAALNSSFNALASAVERQKGTITYTFKAQ